jgi:zinc transporter ZupT
MTTNYEAKHLVPIVKHGATRRQHKRRRYTFVFTPLNVAIFTILAMVVGALIGCAIFKATDAFANYVCDAVAHLAVC